MDSKKYQEEALLTESNDFDSIRERIDDEKIRLLHAAMGMSTEAGEFVDMMKKHIFYGKTLDKVNLFEEIGDVLWYCAIALDVLGEDFHSCMLINNKKLMKRYNNKHFSEKSAIERDLNTERKILEKK